MTVANEQAGEIIRKAVIETAPGEYTFRVDAEVTVPPITIDTTGLATDTNQTSEIALLTTIRDQQTDGSQHVIVDDMPSVSIDTTGLATESKQDTGNTSLGSIDTKLTSQATAAKQDTGNASLSSIDTKLTSQATAAKQDTGNSSLSSIDTKLTSQATSAKQDTGNTSLASIDTKLSSQATDAKQDTGNASLASIDTKLDGPIPITLPNYSADGSFSAPDDQVVISCKGMGSVWIHIQGDWTSGTFTFQGSIKDTPSASDDWFDVQAINLYNLDGNIFFSFDESAAGTYTDFQAMVAGLKWFKFACSSISGGSLDYQIGAAEASAVVSGIMSIIYAGQAGAPWSVTTV